MSEKRGFQYVVMRCVPRVDREEFVNVGVVLFCQSTDFLAAASHVVPAKIAALCAQADLTAIAEALQGIEAVCRGDGSIGPAGQSSLGQRFGWLAAPKSTVIQPGPIHGGLTDDPARQLTHLLSTLVHDRPNVLRRLTS